MTSTPQYVTESGYDALAEKARDHLWMHFTRHSVYYEGGHVPIIVKGDGCYIWDDQGRKYFDGLSGLFTVQVGHGRKELGAAAAKQMEELAYFPIWSYAHRPAIELAERLAHYAPGNLNRVFFTSGGGEAVETAWKLAKQYFKLTGKPTKHKVISRNVAYHGTPQGALSITGIPVAKIPFEPLVPGGVKVPNTNFCRAPDNLRDDEKAFGRWAADRIAEAIEFEGPDSVAAVFLEPVQNSGGCFPPPPGYLERVREICDEYDVLMVADETICAFGRIGDMFAMKRFGVDRAGLRDEVEDDGVSSGGEAVQGVGFAVAAHGRKGRGGFANHHIRIGLGKGKRHAKDRQRGCRENGRAASVQAHDTLVYA